VPGKRYTKQELADRNGLTLYEDFDAASAECLSRLDNELQTIKHLMVRKFPQLDLSSIQPIKDRIVNT
jgi:hypothetical protein